MKTRLLTAIVLLIILAIALSSFFTVIFDVIVLIFGIWALWEVFSAAKIKNSIYLFIPFALLLSFAILSYNNINSIFLTLLTYFFIVFLAVFIMKNISSKSFNKLMLITALKTLICICFFSIIYMKYFFDNVNYTSSSLYFILIALNCAWGADSFAYFAGRLFGKRKLSPNISPNKTVEGAIGGVIGSVILGQVVTYVFLLFSKNILIFTMSDFNLRFNLSIAVICALGAIFGIIGDLFASLIKRVCDVKDYGNIFPGHGGIMDRFDSVTFTMPFVAISSVIFYTNIM